jgi:hypothetical protein
LGAFGAWILTAVTAVAPASAATTTAMKAILAHGAALGRRLGALGAGLELTLARCALITRIAGLFTRIAGLKTAAPTTTAPMAAARALLSLPAAASVPLFAGNLGGGGWGRCGGLTAEETF